MSEALGFRLESLHSTLFILVHEIFAQHCYVLTSLHSTLFILVRDRCRVEVVRLSSTFHSVYISTSVIRLVVHCHCPLHSTLFILVLICGMIAIILLLSLHSTLFILVRMESLQSCLWSSSTFHSVYISTFSSEEKARAYLRSTFHSVYISTDLPGQPVRPGSSLHSTLFILVPGLRIL